MSVPEHGRRFEEEGIPEPEEAGTAQPGEGGESGEAEGEETGQARAPWHFKLVVVGSVVYLGYRAYQGISWLGHHL